MSLKTIQKNIFNTFIHNIHNKLKILCIIFNKKKLIADYLDKKINKK